MSTKVVSGKELRKIGFPEGKVITVIVKTLDQFYKNKSKSYKLELLNDLYQNQDKYLNDEILGRIVKVLRSKTDPPKLTELNMHRMEYSVFGPEGIDEAARNQMEIAMKLPITVAGALMPDAHFGYGLPIGGVLATENAVIPYGVGVDIGCRMCLSIFDLSPIILESDKDRMKKILFDHTKFGNETHKRPDSDAILDRVEFREIKFLSKLKDKAASQIGSSGSGNHFVEFGIIEILDLQNEWQLLPGKYLGLLSHSGSRGLGAEIARYYTKVAMEKTKLPEDARHLAWLDLNTEDGQEYWLGMNLAGDYASACHHYIHRKIGNALGNKLVARIENHHNFAWKEKLSDGKDVIVHRKGATPAGKNVFGIIPGSMTAPGFIVKGKGNAKSLQSASHGAGRLFSRSQAKSLLSKQDVTNHLITAGVELIGGDVDEAPMVYKDIIKVMEYQKELVDVIGTFHPKIVRMSGEK